MDLSANKLIGTLPRYQFYNNTKLRRFYVNKNSHINGTLPFLPHNSSLKCLDVRGTSIGGKLHIEYLKIRNGELFLPTSGFNLTDINRTIPNDSYMTCQVCGTGIRNPCMDSNSNTRSNSQRWDGNRNTKGSSYIWCNSFQNPKENFCRSVLPVYVDPGL